VTATTAIKATFPPKLKLLFRPMRYKVARGGRGSAKSWSFARALLIRGTGSPQLFLCTREIQKSIKDSVHKLLTIQIQKLGLGSFYQVLENEIRGINGTQFIFSGLAQHTIDSLKSYEGIDVCWVEEGQTVSKRSWDILIPTIRKEDSEIWVTYNPELETDETHQRFTMHPPEDCISVLINYTDNPWFPSTLEKERLHCLKTAPKDYPNIWEGKCKPAVEGAIYYDEIAKAEAEGQICNVPYDPLLKVHVVVDIGWNDAMFITLVQKLRSEIRVIGEIEDSHRTLDSYSAELKDMRLNWGKMWLPHDGKHKDVKTGKSCGEILEKLGWDVEYTESVSLEDGIKITRMAIGQMYFDKAKTPRLVQCIKRYRRNVSTTTQESSTPRHDEFSHGADNLRYIALNADKMTNTEKRRADTSKIFRR
jgi:phage terminase large subunit